MPMALFALISWLRNPYNGNKSEVKVNSISKKEQALMWVLTVIVTVVFFYILSYFNTANIVPSTLSVTTSFIAVYLTFRRCPTFALAYAANDIVLIVLWVMAINGLSVFNTLNWDWSNYLLAVAVAKLWFDSTSKHECRTV